MLADTPSLAKGDPTVPTANTQESGFAETATTTVAAPPSSEGNPQKDSAATTDVSPSSDVGDSGVPRVSLPQLGAILGHGGGMTTTDISGVCELVARKEERSRSQNRTQRKSLQGSATPTIVGGTEEAVVLESGSAGGGTEEDLDIVNTKTITDDLNDGGQHDCAATKSQLGQEEPPFTVSFTTVYECEAVRAWLRKGAYTLPAFDVTSGQRQRQRQDT